MNENQTTKGESMKRQFTEWAEEKTDEELLEMMYGDFMQEANRQGLSRGESIMFIIERELTCYDGKRLLKQLLDWTFSEYEHQTRIYRNARAKH